MTRRHIALGVLPGWAIIARVIAAVSYILREDGSYILREDGSKYLREDS
jgi:hypothetical protein